MLLKVIGQALASWEVLYCKEESFRKQKEFTMRG